VVSAPVWETLAESVQGLNKQQNQDWFTAEGQGTDESPLILAVADGHGSRPHPRSHLGARYAVVQFAALAEEFTGYCRTLGPREPESLRKLMAYAQQDLPRRIVANWTRQALGHWDRYADPSEEAQLTERQKLRLYGTTLVGAVLTPHLFAAWQIGDGDLTVIEYDGAVSRPLAPTEPDIGDETESLCEPDAWRQVRVHWAPVFEPDRMPRLISLSTDGLSKSFASDDGFTTFVSGVDQRIAAEGAEAVRDSLPGWLTQAAGHSGDDTTFTAGRRLTHHQKAEDRQP
jgi:Protein phosphatase 2C